MTRGGVVISSTGGGKNDRAQYINSNMSRRLAANTVTFPAPVSVDFEHGKRKFKSKADYGPYLDDEHVMTGGTILGMMFAYSAYFKYFAPADGGRPTTE